MQLESILWFSIGVAVLVAVGLFMIYHSGNKDADKNQGKHTHA